MRNSRWAFVLQKLVADGFYDVLPSILLTSKGLPDQASM
jgi:hypothetical protein